MFENYNNPTPNEETAKTNEVSKSAAEQKVDQLIQEIDQLVQDKEIETEKNNSNGSFMIAYKDGSVYKKTIKDNGDYTLQFVDNVTGKIKQVTRRDGEIKTQSV